MVDSTRTSEPVREPSPLPRFEEGVATAEGSANRALLDLERILDLRVAVTVELASTRLSIADVLALEPGGVLELDRDVREPVDVLVGGMRLARGEIVHVGDRYGVRIVEILDPEDRVRLARES